MKELLLHMVTGFFGAFGFAFLFQTPKRSHFFIGITGMLGWTVNYLFQTFVGTGVPLDIVGNFLNGLILGICAQIFGHIQKVSPTVYYITGVIPPVPGGTIYMMFYSLIVGEYAQAAVFLRSIIVITGSLALGIFVASRILGQFLGEPLYVDKKKAAHQHVVYKYSKH